MTVIAALVTWLLVAGIKLFVAAFWLAFLWIGCRNIGLDLRELAARWHGRQRA